LFNTYYNHLILSARDIKRVQSTDFPIYARKSASDPQYLRLPVYNDAMADERCTARLFTYIYILHHIGIAMHCTIAQK
jgi:hypothetical protein